MSSSTRPESVPQTPTAPAESASAPVVAPTPTKRVETIFLWLRDRDQLLLGGMGLVALVLMGIHWARLSGWGMKPVEIVHLENEVRQYKPLEYAPESGSEEQPPPGSQMALARKPYFAGYDDRIHLNSANELELQQLPGVGEILAERIVQYRSQHGPFETIEELRQVKGIGVKTLDRIREKITLEEPGE